MPPTIISTNDIISSVSKQHKQKGTAFNIQHSIMLLFPNKSKVTRNHLRQNKKAWELYLLSVPLLEAFALPILSKRTTSKPTPIWIQFTLGMTYA